MLGESDPWLMSRSSHRASDPAYYIEDCRIYSFWANVGKACHSGFRVVAAIFSAVHRSEPGAENTRDVY